VTTHDAPAISSDDRPTLLKISESPDRQSDAAAAKGFERVREEDTVTEQAENCRYRFDHRRGPYAPPAKNRMRIAQSKRFLDPAGFRSPADDSGQQMPQAGPSIAAIKTQMAEFASASPFLPPLPCL
jgi:hypothetical protein